MYDLDTPVVCIEHGCFIPCRKQGGHYTTQDPRWVKAVRDYQSSADDGLAWSAPEVP